MKLKAPESCKSLSLEGKSVEIIGGIVEVATHIEFLLDNGFSIIKEESQEEPQEEPKKKTRGR